MSKRTDRIDQILTVALDLLRTQGDFGVTMRKVATICDISLSSLQYYYKTKDDLLKAMADRHFNECMAMIKELPQITSEEELTVFLNEICATTDEMEEMGAIFKEYWALSTRNEVVREYLEQYYSEFNSIMFNMLRPVAVNEKALSQSVVLLIPYMEGYAVASSFMPQDKDTITTMLRSVVWHCLRQTS